MSSLPTKEREGIATESALYLQRLHNLAPKRHHPTSRSKQCWDLEEGETMDLKQNLDKNTNKSKKRLPFLDKPAHLPIHIVSSSFSSSSSSSVPSLSDTSSASDLAPKHIYMAAPVLHAHHRYNPFDGYSLKYQQTHPLSPSHQHSTPKPDERSKFSKKKSRSKSESHGDAKENDRDKKDKDKKDKTPYHHHRSSSNQTPSTIESLFQQERQLREIVDERMVLEEWLFKRSSSLQLVWKRRWCVLRDDCLYYYNSNVSIPRSLFFHFLTVGIR